MPLAYFALAAVAAAAPASAPAPIAGVPLPPDPVFETELTRVATERARLELKGVLAQLEGDRSQSVQAKTEMKQKLSRLKIAVYTTPRSLDETVAVYEKKIEKATFLFGERNLLADLLDVARAGGFSVTPEAQKAWTGKTVRSARWGREDGAVEIDVEDHLIDPRNGQVAKKTVVLITSIGE
ncbi:MAG: hypothetical protein ABIT01_06645 [Thermoanaerobaculia bacterium]